MRTTWIILLIGISFSLTLAQTDSLTKHLLALEYNIYKIQGDLEIEKLLIFEQATFLFDHGKNTEALTTLDRLNQYNDSLLVTKVNRLRARIYFKQRDYISAYNYMNGTNFTTKKDSLLYEILLIENVRIKELLNFQTTMNKQIVDSIETYYHQYSQKTDVDCERYFTKSRVLPGSGLFAQNKYKQGFVNLGLIGGFFTYGLCHALNGYYITGILTGGNFTYQFYKSGARLSHNVCLEEQKKAKDEFKGHLYRLLLSVKN